MNAICSTYPVPCGQEECDMSPLLAAIFYFTDCARNVQSKDDMMSCVGCEDYMVRSEWGKRDKRFCLSLPTKILPRAADDRQLRRNRQIARESTTTLLACLPALLGCSGLLLRPFMRLGAGQGGVLR